MLIHATFYIFILSDLISWNSDAFFLNRADNNTAIRVASFNLQHFGDRKMNDATVAKRIVQILSQYDVVLIQEVHDSEHHALDKLLTSLQLLDSSWSYISSLPVGRKSYKEQYVFYYKRSLISVESCHQILDPQDIYERDPYAILVKYFSVSKTELRKVILLGIHTKPEDAKNELKMLEGTIKNVTDIWSNADSTITMGDFNADCRYLAGKYRSTYAIFSTAAGFRSLINDEADTTVKNTTDCSYDRIVVYGAETVVGDAKVYDFMKELHLTQSESLNISDHFPVEFQLY